MAAGSSSVPDSWGLPETVGHGPPIAASSSPAQVASKPGVGRLEPDAVKRVVRQAAGQFRLCYEATLRTSPGLSERMSVRFIIARDGSVHDAKVASSTVADSTTAPCVVAAFAKLTFPPPDGGIVTVVYPISFSPGD
jgi:hypothetical protein